MPRWASSMSLLLMAARSLALQPEQNSVLAGEGAASPRIAYCLAGGMRTFPEPNVYKSVAENLVGDSGDLFLVMYTSFDDSHKSSLKRAGPEELAKALRHTKPKGIELLSREFETGCANQRQFQMWARCATLIEEYENKTGTHYDLIFRSRPDLEWTMKQSHVEAVAKKFDMLNDKRVVLSAEDQIHFFHRDQIGFLKDMSKTKDPEVCEELFKVCYKIIMDDFDKPKGKKICPVMPRNSTYAHAKNSYCPPMAFAENRGLRHVECKGSKKLCSKAFCHCEKLQSGELSSFENVFKIYRADDYVEANKTGATKAAFVASKRQQVKAGGDSDPLWGIDCDKSTSGLYTCRRCATHFIKPHADAEARSILTKMPPCKETTMESLVREGVDMMAGGKVPVQWTFG